MNPESNFINEAKRQVGSPDASYVNVLFFNDEDPTSYTGSILPFRTEGPVGFETAFKFQEAIRQVVRMQEANGQHFQHRRIGIIVADKDIANAEMITDAVTGVFVLARAEIAFSLATDHATWLNTQTHDEGPVFLES